MRHSNKQSIEEFGEDDMPCTCTQCSEWFDLTDGVTNPRKDNEVICESCARKIEAEIEREEEIEDLLTQISDAEFTLENCRERLKELNYEPVKN